MRGISCDPTRTGSFVIALTVQMAGRVHYCPILKQRIGGQAGMHSQARGRSADYSMREPLQIAFGDLRLRPR